MVMTDYLIEQFRPLVDSPDWPLNPEQWPEELNKSTNCLAFALGLPYADEEKLLFSTDFQKRFICETLTAMNFEFREISSLNDLKDNEIVIKCYKDINIPGNFHVIRRNLDGTWVHKEGWYEAPEKIHSWSIMNLKYPPEKASFMFAVKKRAS